MWCYNLKKGYYAQKNVKILKANYSKLCLPF